jgi:arsenate reductase
MARAKPKVVIYHNPACTTSRKVLGMIRSAGTKPKVVEYLKTPPSRTELTQLLRRMGLTPRQLLRKRGTPYEALGLGDPSLSDDALIDAILAHPILMERPVVVGPGGVRLCRPPERVREVLPS